ncbi:MAG: 2-keto-4-pentenoate hydratase/2-oxohepta-3-ene-1,7-dioic acid hydratase in catechol pathway [Planctomycetota bacterium]|jgi:2-keto-4-pentenoate hydratase/2-oxohepta-3-ene-1,7-dioic acid hydratase in catechol pathway
MPTISYKDRQITPAKIVCIGRNFHEHIQELGNETPDDMVIFVKPNSAISQDLHSFHQETLHYEGEISFLVQNQRLCAVGFGLDLTKRELQSRLKAKGLPWEKAKAFDGAACFSHFVDIDEADFPALTLNLEINGELTQQGGYELMIYKPQQIIDGVAEFMSLQDNDIVMTGTPKGVGMVNRGDRFSASIKCGERVLLSHEWTAV